MLQYKSCTTNIDKVDYYHNELFELMESLKNQLKNGKYFIARETAAVLQRKLIAHCEHEEKFMESFSYPFISEHKLEHTRIIQLMSDIVEMLRDTDVVYWAIASKLYIAFVDHVDRCDMQYADFYNTKRLIALQ